MPELRSDECLDLRILAIEIWSILSVKPPKKVLHILGARLNVPALEAGDYCPCNTITLWGGAALRWPRRGSGGSEVVPIGSARSK